MRPIGFLLVAVLLLACQTGADADGKERDIRATIEAGLSPGATIEEVHAFLLAHADGVADRPATAEWSTFLRSRGVPPDALVLGARWDVAGGGLIKSSIHVDFRFEQGIYTVYYVQQVHTGP